MSIVSNIKRYCPWYNQFKMYSWKKKLHLNQKAAVFEQLFSEYNGYTLSLAARKQYDAIDYVYGEIDFISFIALLSLAHPHERTVFYDLGSGLGKAVIACAMVYPVKKSCGIECMASLYQVSDHIKHRLCALPSYQQCFNQIVFLHDDFLAANLADATLIFVNATCFWGETWQSLSRKIAQLPAIEWVISTTKPLATEVMHVVRSTLVQMSWGVVTVYLQQRKEKNHVSRKTIE